MPDRVMIYIDGSNVYHSLKSIYGYTNLDFEAFTKKLAGKRQLVRVYYYNAPVDHTKEPERYKDQQTFFNRMRRIPYLEVRLGRLVVPPWVMLGRVETSRRSSFRLSKGKTLYLPASE